MLKISHPNISEKAIEAVARVLRSGQLVHGEECEAFELEIANYLDCKDAILVSSGTAALHVALLALNLGPGDAVIVPDFTFPATANAVAMTGAEVIIVDVLPENYTIDTVHLENIIQQWNRPETLRAIIPVHEFGCMANMSEIMRIANDHSLKVIEDAACALGAQQQGRKAGTIGDIGCFSFHPRKTITTGEGGAITTNNPVLAARMRRLRNHGIERIEGKIAFIEPALNYRLTNFQAALGRSQLPGLDGWISKRKKLAELYVYSLKKLTENGHLKCPELTTGHSWQTFMVVLSSFHDRDLVIQELKTRLIEANLGAQSLSTINSYNTLNSQQKTGSILFKKGLALPLHEQLKDTDIKKITQTLEDILINKNSQAND
jgi:dTDP-4-amino-4,6-dideoxygalactose transaminase|tara:strand:- start:8844 stop:9974 length:1131 start_codon:yes stop_codon:yes gene_type:complete